MKRQVTLVAAAACLVAAGCGESVGSPEERVKPAVSGRAQGIALTLDLGKPGQVAGMAFAIDDCNGMAVVRQTRTLEDLVLPGGIPAFEEAPFASDSGHVFADHFEVLPAGCYNVRVVPLGGDGEPSAACQAAQALGIEILDGQTREVLLVSQCAGPERGAMDTVAALNHPPAIESLHYSPSKFVFECETTEICATAQDSNGDPMEMVWRQVSGEKLHSAPRVVRREQEGERLTECVELAALFNGAYGFELQVFDIGGTASAPRRLEEILGKPSRETMSFPLYVNWDTELQCYDAESQSYALLPGVREIQRPAGCNPVWPHQFYCSPYKWPHTEVTCPGGVFDPSTVYPACEDSD